MELLEIVRLVVMCVNLDTLRLISYEQKFICKCLAVTDRSLCVYN